MRVASLSIAVRHRPSPWGVSRMATKWANVETIGSYFESLPDPRHTRNRKHLLTDVVVIAVCALVCGCDGPTAIHRWATQRRDWLRPFLALANGLPSRDCIRRVLTAIKPEAFQECFRNWVRDALPVDDTAPARLIAIDGKTCRRSHDAGQGLGPLHLVSAWASEQGIALGQVATDAKSNEITAIPELLERIELSNAVVTIDAIGCQKEIARQIVAGGGDFVLTVKDNQPKLHAAVRDYFLGHRERDLAVLRHRGRTTSDLGHGRHDERSYVLTKVPSDFAPAKDWPWVKAIGYAARVTRHPDGRETNEVRYYVLSRYLSGERFGRAVRGHWGIEAMHWVLDVNFREDDLRTRERTLGNNLSWLRRFAVTLLKQHPVQDSLRGKMIRCLMSPAFLTEVLTMQGD